MCMRIESIVIRSVMQNSSPQKYRERERENEAIGKRESVHLSGVKNSIRVHSICIKSKKRRVVQNSVGVS
jgi:hypothetical protein